MLVQARRWLCTEGITFLLQRSTQKCTPCFALKTTGVNKGAQATFLSCLCVPLRASKKQEGEKCTVTKCTHLLACTYVLLRSKSRALRASKKQEGECSHGVSKEARSARERRAAFLACQRQEGDKGVLCNNLYILKC